MHRIFALLKHVAEYRQRSSSAQSWRKPNLNNSGKQRVQTTVQLCSSFWAMAFPNVWRTAVNVAWCASDLEWRKFKFRLKNGTCYKAGLDKNSDNFKAVEVIAARPPSSLRKVLFIFFNIRANGHLRIVLATAFPAQIFLIQRAAAITRSKLATSSEVFATSQAASNALMHDCSVPSSLIRFLNSVETVESDEQKQRTDLLHLDWMPRWLACPAAPFFSPDKWQVDSLPRAWVDFKLSTQASSVHNRFHWPLALHLRNNFLQVLFVNF